MGEENQLRAMRESVRGTVRRAGGALLAATPTGLIAVLCVGAVTPVAAAAIGAGSAVVAGVGVLGSVGANILTEVINRGINAAREESMHNDSEMEEVLEAALLKSVESSLLDQSIAPTLRREIADVLRHVDAVGAAVEAVVEAGDRTTQQIFATSMDRIGARFSEFDFMLSSMNETTAAVLKELTEQNAGSRAAQAIARAQATQIRLIRDDIAALLERSQAFSQKDYTSRVRENSCPYLGLASFGEEDTDIFYGREELTARLVTQISEQLSERRFLLVTGPSGAGKSSLLKAGLLPALARGQLGPGTEDWPRVYLTPTRDPILELAFHLASAAASDPAQIRAGLMADPTSAPLYARQGLDAHRDRRRGRNSGRPRMIIIIDQLEELFTLASGSDSRALIHLFIDALAALSGANNDHPGLAVVIAATRSDFLDDCSGVPALADAISGGPFFVGRMKESDLRRAISGPAAFAGLEIDQNLPEIILSDLATEPGMPDSSQGRYSVAALPLLSQAMRVTWEHRQGQRLSIRSYGQAGGVSGAIRRSAEEAFEELSDEQQQVARRVFSAMTVVASGGRIARRRVSVTLLEDAESFAQRPAVRSVLEAFTRRRLVLLDADEAEIAHDMLFTEWPRLAEWLEADGALIVLHNQLAEDSNRWWSHNRDRAFLYRGSRLAAISSAIRRWESQPERFPPLNDRARRFLAEGLRAERRSARVRLAVTACLVIALVGSLVGVAQATRSAREAKQQRESARAEQRIAVSRQLAAQSGAVLNTNPTLAQLLAAAAWRLEPTQDAHQAMLSSLTNPLRAVLYGPSKGENYLVKFSPDGSLLATASQEGLIRIWDSATRQAKGRDIRVRGDQITDMAFSEDGQILIAVAGSQIQFWSVRNRKIAGKVIDIGADILDIDVDHTYGRLAVSTRSALRIIDLSTRRSVRTIPAGVGRQQFDRVDFSPDGKLLVSGGTNVQIWSGRNFDDSLPLPTNGTFATSVDFSPDGRRIAIVEDNPRNEYADGNIHIYDVARRTQVGLRIPELASGIGSAIFSPDGSFLASSDGEGATVRLWDVANHRQIGPPLAGHSGVLGLPVAFSPDGGILASAAADTGVRLWDIRIWRQLARPLIGHESSLTGLVFSPDSNWITSGSLDGAVRRYDIAKRQAVGTPIRPSETSSGDDISGDSQLYAALGNGSIEVWSVLQRRGVGTKWELPLDGISDVALNSNGDLIAIDGSEIEGKSLGVQVWDVYRHRLLHRVPRITGNVIAVRFIGHDRLLLLSDRGFIRVWDAHSRHFVGPRIAAEKGDLSRQLEASGDGTRIATASGSVVQVSSVATGRRVGVPVNATLAGNYPIIALNSTGSILATAGYADYSGGGVTLWDVATGRPISSTRLNTGAATALRFSPDDKILAVGTDNGPIELWGVALPADPYDFICSANPRRLSSDESESYSQDLDLTGTCR